MKKSFPVKYSVTNNFIVPDMIFYFLMNNY